tara:strand:- start:82 stop:234 length:153 start_codon:yes stop_codon:yes gene_type:complete
MLRVAFLLALLFPAFTVADDRWLGAEIEARLIDNRIVGEANDFFGVDFKI